MRPAAFPAPGRRLAWLVLLLPGALPAAEASGLAAPSRPGAAPPAATEAAPPSARPAFRRLGRREYITLADVARHLGLRVTFADRGRRGSLAGAGVAAAFEAESREAAVNGVRLFLGDPAALLGDALAVSRVDFERALVPLLRPGLGVAARPAPKVIVLDPGHGGNDPGRVNPALRLEEKTLTLDLARRVRRLLEADGFKVVLTREADTFVALPQRAAASNLVQADAFVSLHLNALPNDTRTSGVEVYTFPPRGQRSTNAWGSPARDDAEPQASPVHRFDHWSSVLAHAVHRRLVGEVKAPDRGKKLMHLAALRPLNAPGVLVECGFLTSAEEARRLATPEYRQQLAAAVAAGIRDYARTLSSLRGSSRTATAPSSPPR